MKLNTVILSGNLTDDPVPGASQHPLCTFTLAFDAPYGLDRGGAERRRDFVSVVAFGRTAHDCLKRLKRGSRVVVDGRLREDRWQTRSAGPRSRIAIVCDRINFVAGLRKDGPSGAAPEDSQGLPQPSAPQGS